jgi:hypothetical protein
LHRLQLIEEGAMQKKMSRRTWFIAIVVAVAGGALVGGVVAAESRDGGVPANVESALLTDPLVKVADIPGDDGHVRRGVFLQETSAGFVCVWDAPNASSQARRGVCNPQSDPLGGKALSVNFTFDGGPAVTSFSDARLFGLAAGNVARLQVVMSDGSRRELRLVRTSAAGKPVRAFGHRVGRTDLAHGVTPVAVVALDADGNELDRQATGF